MLFFSPVARHSAPSGIIINSMCGKCVIDATELLLGPHEQINAWSYEDGYLTYATDESATAIMRAQAGSLRRLRMEIRQSPNFDPTLEIISGQSLYLLDQRAGTGPGTASFYRGQSARLLRGFHRASFSAEYDRSRLAQALLKYVSPVALALDGSSVIDHCLNRGGLASVILMRSLPSKPDEADGTWSPGWTA
jgi:hypothetical protein